LTAALFATTPAAAVDYTCAPHDHSQNGVVSTSLSVDGTHWRVVHHLANGDVAVRNDQYDIRGTLIGWEGHLWSKPALRMVGILAGMIYRETLYDGERFIIETSEECAPTVAALPLTKHKFDNTDDLEAAKQRMVVCLKHFPSPHDGVEKDMEVEIRRDTASCGEDFLAMLQQTGATWELSIASAELIAYEALGCRYANPTEEDIKNTPEGMRMVICSSGVAP
jgi:hypothetical protein